MKEEYVAVGFLVDLQVLALECLVEPGFHVVEARHVQRHQLEDRAVGGRHFRQGPAADQERDVRGGDFLALEKREGSPLLPGVDAVGTQGASCPEKEFSRRKRFGKAQGHEVLLLLQARRDDKGHVQLFAEYRIDEGHQRHLVKAHLDRVSREIPAELIDDALRDGALDDDARGIHYRKALALCPVCGQCDIRWRCGFRAFLWRAYGFGQGIHDERTAGGGQGGGRHGQAKGGPRAGTIANRCPRGFL